MERLHPVIIVEALYGVQINLLHNQITIALSQMSKIEFTRILPWRAIALLRTFVQGESRDRQTCLIGLCRAAAKRLLKTNLGGRSAERPYCRAQPNFRASECRAELVRAMPSAAENLKAKISKQKSQRKGACI